MKKKFLLITFILFTAIALTDSNAQNTSGNQLADFQALQKGNAVQLSWTALYETDLQSHEVERSANGTSFTNIGTITAQNNAGAYKYSFLDAAPVETTNYYRLRSIDKKGNVTFSSIIRVSNGFGKTDVRVWPNPVQGGALNLQFSNINSGKYNISLYGNNGQIVFARSLILTSGSITETINLPRTLGKGLYFLQFTDGQSRINRQVLLQ